MKILTLKTEWEKEIKCLITGNKKYKLFKLSGNPLAITDSGELCIEPLYVLDRFVISCRSYLEKVELIKLFETKFQIFDNHRTHPDENKPFLINPITISSLDMENFDRNFIVICYEEDRGKFVDFIKKISKNQNYKTFWFYNEQLAAVL